MHPVAHGTRARADRLNATTEPLRPDGVACSCHSRLGVSDGTGQADIRPLRPSYGLYTNPRTQLFHHGVPENLVHATAEYEAGYLVVRGRWFALEQRSPRGCTLPTEEVLVVVNTMIRVPWVLFNGSAAGKAPRESRSGLYILGEEWYNRLLESV